MEGLKDRPKVGRHPKISKQTEYRKDHSEGKQQPATLDNKAGRKDDNKGK
jgi:hypothetical protein